MIEYQLKYNKVWKNYPNLESVCWSLVEQLYKHRAPELLLNGTFEPTCYMHETFYKRYVVVLNVPYTKYIVCKQSKGDINQKVFLETLKEIKEMYERIQNKH